MNIPPFQSTVQKVNPASRQFDPAFVVAPAATVARGIENDREVAPDLAGPGGLFVVDEELPSNDFKFARAIEVLAGQADASVQFMILEHGKELPKDRSKTTARKMHDACYMICTQKIPESIRGVSLFTFCISYFSRLFSKSL